MSVMRAALALGPRTGGEWLSGLLLSAPVAAVLWWTRGEPESVQTAVAIAAVVLAIPWVVPAMMLIGAASSPIYMWLHTQGPVPPVLVWLGGVVLVSAVIGCHVNAALAMTWWHQRRKAQADPGLREFLERQTNHPNKLDRAS